jgi:hypothetical protein
VIGCLSGADGCGIHTELVLSEGLGTILVGGDNHKALLQIVDRAGILIVEAMIKLTAYAPNIMPVKALMVDKLRMLGHLNSHILCFDLQRRIT